MRTVPLSEAKAKLSRLLDSVEGRDEEIVITRNGRAAAVLVSPGDFESWKETMAVRSDAGLVAEIRRGLAALRRGKAKLYTLEELFPD
jgi:prevent-host-death family protein